MNYSKANIFFIFFLATTNFAVFPQTYGTHDITVPPTESSFTYPQSVFIDSPQGHIWVADFDNHRVLRFDVSTLTSVVESGKNSQPQDFILSQNYPNPFNGQTLIKFSAKSEGNVVLSVYNLLGQKIITLFNNVATANKTYSIAFDPNNLPSGIYLYSLRTEYGNAVKRMCFLK